MRYYIRRLRKAVIAGAIISLLVCNPGYTAMAQVNQYNEVGEETEFIGEADLPELRADGDTLNFSTYTMKFDKSDIIGYGTNGSYIGEVVAVKVKSKTMLKVEIDPETVVNNCYVGLYSSKDITGDSLVTEQYLSKGNNEQCLLETYVKTGGILYIGIKAYGSGLTFNDGSNLINIKPYYIDGNDRDLKEGEWTLAPKTNNSNSNIYYKFELKKQAYVTFESDNKGMLCAILNSSKNIVENNVLINKAKGYRTTSKLKAGVYYLRTSGYGAKEYKLRYTVEDELSISNENETMWFAPSTSNDFYYIRINPGETGYMRVKVGTNDESYRMDMVLCDVNKKKISNSITVSGSYGYRSNYYGVTGGQTYYLRLKGDCCKIGIEYSLSVVKDIGGEAFDNAKNLKLGTKYTSIIANGSKADKWFSFKIKKNKKIQLDFLSTTVGTVTYEVYGNSSKKPVKGGKFTASGENVSKTLKSKNKYTMGTYRIRVYTSNPYTSGKFSIRVK